MPQRSNIVATWSDQKKVHLWNTMPLLRALSNPPVSNTITGQSATAAATSASANSSISGMAPVQSLNHKDEGFALAWSPTKEGEYEQFFFCFFFLQ